MGQEQEKPNCSFCAKNQTQVGKLIAGPPNVYICDECVDLCNDILEEAIPAAHDSQVHAPRESSSDRFHRAVLRTLPVSH